jgi:hypothetical protein
MVEQHTVVGGDEQVISNGSWLAVWVSERVSRRHARIQSA